MTSRFSKVSSLQITIKRASSEIFFCGFFRIYLFIEYLQVTSSEFPKTFKTDVFQDQKQSYGRVFCKIGVFKNSQNSQENTCARVCEFCEIFKNIFFAEHLRWLLLQNNCGRFLLPLRMLKDFIHSLVKCKF